MRIKEGRLNNTSGITGIQWREDRKAWVVSWKLNGKRKSRDFKVNKFESKESALKCATEFLKECKGEKCPV